MVWLLALFLIGNPPILDDGEEDDVDIIVIEDEENEYEF